MHIVRSFVLPRLSNIEDYFYLFSAVDCILMSHNSDGGVATEHDGAATEHAKLANALAAMELVCDWMRRKARQQVRHSRCDGPVCTSCGSDAREDAWYFATNTLAQRCNSCYGTDCGNMMCPCKLTAWLELNATCRSCRILICHSDPATD